MTIRLLTALSAAAAVAAVVAAALQLPGSSAAAAAAAVAGSAVDSSAIEGAGIEGSAIDSADSLLSEAQLQRRLRTPAEGGGCGDFVRNGRRPTRQELGRYFSEMVREHTRLHAGRKRHAPVCGYTKRGMWACKYKRLERPYAYHWPIMNILGGALGKRSAAELQ